MGSVSIMHWLVLVAMPCFQGAAITAVTTPHLAAFAAVPAIVMTLPRDGQGK